MNLYVANLDGKPNPNFKGGSADAVQPYTTSAFGVKYTRSPILLMHGLADGSPE
jgi:hypothetical protein